MPLDCGMRGLEGVCWYVMGIEGEGTNGCVDCLARFRGPVVLITAKVIAGCGDGTHFAMCVYGNAAVLLRSVYRVLQKIERRVDQEGWSIRV